jgi:RNA polymerase sigma-70 factor (ECF subfamily)
MRMTLRGPAQLWNGSSCLARSSKPVIFRQVARIIIWTRTMSAVRVNAVMPTALVTETEAREQFSELLERHRGIVLKVANTYCRAPWDRDDLAQEIAAQLWRAFPSFDAKRKFSTWMYRIALNVAISFVRSSGIRARHTVQFDESRHDIESPETDDNEDQARIELLHAFLEELDELNRALLLLYLDELSYRDIADVLGITETNVATKISRLKQRFRSKAISEQRGG